MSPNPPRHPLRSNSSSRPVLALRNGALPNVHREAMPYLRHPKSRSLNTAVWTRCSEVGSLKSQINLNLVLAGVGWSAAVLDLDSVGVDLGQRGPETKAPS